MKKSLMMMLCLLCVASLVAGMAYSRAAVDTDSKITLSATTDALLAFDIGDDSDMDKTVTIKDNKVVMNFESAGHGIQANGSYGWDNCVKVTNNSKNAVKFYVNEDINAEFIKQIPNGMSYSMYTDGTDGKRVYLYSNIANNGEVELAAGESCKLTVDIACNGDVDPSKDIDANLRFSADRVEK